MRKTKHTSARRARFVAGGVVGTFAIVAALLASPNAPSGELPAVAAASVSSTAPIRTVVEPATVGTASVVGEVASLTVKSVSKKLAKKYTALAKTYMGKAKTNASKANKNLALAKKAAKAKSWSKAGSYAKTAAKAASTAKSAANKATKYATKAKKAAARKHAAKARSYATKAASYAASAKNAATKPVVKPPAPYVFPKTPPTFTKGPGYIPFDQCDGGLHHSHQVGWGGNSRDGANMGRYGTWSAYVKDDTVYYYICLV